MAKTLREWVDTDVASTKGKPFDWLSQQYFFRDPIRPYYIDSTRLFSPADGVIMYQKVMEPDECILEIKGKNYTLRESMQDPSYNRKSLVIGIFMTFYDVHVNRMPSFGYLSYKHLDRIQSYNYPMLEIEDELVEQLKMSPNKAEYLFYNQRVLSTIYAPAIQQNYYLVQFADYGVNMIVPFTPKQNQPFFQTRRFSQIRYGSQVDFILPISDKYGFDLLQTVGMHVEAGVDPLIKIRPV